MTEAAIPIREVLRLLLQADSYPCLGNDDWRVADRMEAEAFKKAAAAVPLPDDPPEFGLWLDTLRKPGLQNPEREEVYAALHDYFDEATRTEL
jgi:hypothetical protein